MRTVLQQFWVVTVFNHKPGMMKLYLFQCLVCASLIVEDIYFIIWKIDYSHAASPGIQVCQYINLNISIAQWLEH